MGYVQISSSIQTVTVGAVVSTAPSLAGIADFTADREFHPAPKVHILLLAI